MTDAAAPAPEVVVLPDRATLVERTADRLVARLVQLQRALTRPVSLVLTGGTVGIDVLAAVARRPGDVDWAGLELWWGDERFVGADDPERNDLQARQALLDRVPVDPARVHPFPAADGPGEDDGGALSVTAAARRFEPTVAAAGPFDVVLLGIGPDGHVASLFPGLDGIEVTDRAVVPVRDSPKPPPLRLSLTLPVINAAAEVWVHAAGLGKARAAAAALHPASDEPVLPAGRVRGRQRTLWLLDAEAASALPS